MFTGIVEDLGTVVRLDRGTDFARLTVDSPVAVTNRTVIGESIAVNGVCLTVTAVQGTAFTADMMHETLRCSSLGFLRRGDHVDVERAMPAAGRFSGHIVSGHIDGTGLVESITPDGIAKVYTIRAPYELMRFIAQKGSITIEGISLTVTSVTDDTFGVSIIPHTASHTVLAERGIGSIVNIETDPIAKYVDRLLALPSHGGDSDSRASEAITERFLIEHGF
ncbi:riboflavin synthase subunit alpha [Bifidobacterium hapali]|uniref:Riboflavin synthase n=1 Tax=Bifidobacterium hapali TaxID=1630172 RepID=A0A261G5F8_9BIFI|nr:riboflavin synthase [Bifidobacterium hapali]OZG66435.1 riboflavin synthase subunit alpha [Bifidobacterium hapali]